MSQTTLYRLHSTCPACNHESFYGPLTENGDKTITALQLLSLEECHLALNSLMAAEPRCDCGELLDVSCQADDTAILQPRG
jgi:hypothetical protein